MANSSEIQAFISAMITQAQKGYSDYGVLPSVTIAQGAWESGWGLSPLAQNDKNLFGIKFAGNHDSSISVTQGTAPSDGTGGYYCHYNSWGDSCLDHGYFLKNNSRYSALFSQSTPETQLNAIWQAGYAQEADGSLTVGYVENIMSIITANNLTQYDTGTAPTDNYGEQVENAVKWMVEMANDNTHGYDQDNRWGDDYDCSSFVISGYEQAGIPLKTNGATYTGDLKAVAITTGFHEVTWGNDITKLVRGDILLNEIHHTAVFIGDGKIVQASANENGTATGGQTGDQTGKEIYIRDYYVYTSGWDCVLRYHDGATGGGEPTTGGAVWAKLIKTSYNIKQLTAEQTTYLKTLAFNGVVKIKSTFNKRKSNGVTFTGKRLTIDDLSYIIVDVENNGFIKLTTSLENKCYKFVNPSLIKEV